MPDNNPSSAFPDIFPPREIRILGAGRFGRIAAARLQPRFPTTPIFITDRDSRKAAETATEFGILSEAGDAVEDFCNARLPEDTWVVPAVPVHLGFEWLFTRLSRSRAAERLAVPGEVDAMVPNPIRSPSGTLYASYATFICPDHCKEPEAICTHTGKARSGNLFETFGRIRLPEFEVAVLRSWQLAPGVGGYPVRSLNALFSLISSVQGRYLVATSCRCHGVMDGLRWREGAEDRLRGNGSPA
ncbi:MAG: hypothetical protein LLG06_00505 [Desulfobacteraceae bacterium]|nr:hypothetical protein [Desulfobacteraceae bacterium]